MAVFARTWFTPQKGRSLERWRRGQCVADIARALARRNNSGVYHLGPQWWDCPAPARAPRALRLPEREEISQALPWLVDAADPSGLGRSPSTVSREIRRNGGCGAGRKRS